MQNNQKGCAMQERILVKKGDLYIAVKYIEPENLSLDGQVSGLLQG